MNREPVYHKETRKLRVVSVTNGEWQAQRHIGRDHDADRTIETGWENIGRPSTFEIATQRMNAAYRP